MSQAISEYYAAIPIVEEVNGTRRRVGFFTLLMVAMMVMFMFGRVYENPNVFREMRVYEEEEWTPPHYLREAERKAFLHHQELHHYKHSEKKSHVSEQPNDDTTTTPHS